MIGGSNEPSTMRVPKRWPLVSPFYTRSSDTPITQDSRLINGFVEQDPSDGEYWIYKRAGIAPTPTYTPAVNFPGGTYYNLGTSDPLSITTPTTGLTAGLGTLYLGNTAIGLIPRFAAGVQNVTQYQWWFETIGGGSNQIVVMNSGGGAVYNTSTGFLTGISDPNYPAYAVPGWGYLDGTLYVMDATGNIWGTASTYNALVWDGLNVVPASTQGDLGMFLASQLTYIVAFKQWTTQIFYDAENQTGSPLSPVPDAQIPYGCLHPNSVQKIDEILIWLTSNKTISPQIIMMENLTPKIISTPSVERLLDNIQINAQPVGAAVGGASSINDNTLFSWTFKHAGHRFYGLIHTVLNFTLVYDIDQKFWYLWFDVNGNYWPMTNFTFISPTLGSKGIHFAQIMVNGLGTQGQLYAIDSMDRYPNDAGTLFPVDIYTPNFNGGTIRRKTLNMMYFSADETPGSILQARYSDDDYKTWSNFRSISLNDSKPFLDNEGTFESKRAYHFRHQCNTKFRIKSSDLQIALGTL